MGLFGLVNVRKPPLAPSPHLGSSSSSFGDNETDGRVCLLAHCTVVFNMYVLSENNTPQGLYCSLYDRTWDKSYSTNYGQYRGNAYYSVSQSYGYTLNA